METSPLVQLYAGYPDYRERKGTVNNPLALLNKDTGALVSVSAKFIHW